MGFSPAHDCRHIRNGDIRKFLFLCRTVLGDKEVGIVYRVCPVWVDDLHSIPVRGGKIPFDPFHHILHAFPQDAADGEGYGVGILYDGGLAVQDRGFRVRRGKSGGKAVKDQAGEHQHKKHREHQQDSGCRQNLSDMFPAFP